MISKFLTIAVISTGLTTGVALAQSSASEKSVSPNDGTKSEAPASPDANRAPGSSAANRSDIDGNKTNSVNPSAARNGNQGDQPASNCGAGSPTGGDIATTPGGGTHTQSCP
jgi:hypothetical protein